MGKERLTSQESGIVRFCNEIRTLCGREIWVGQKRIKDVMYAYEGRGNPILWFVKTLDDQDMIICGLPTKREALSEAERILKEDSND